LGWLHAARSEGRKQDEYRSIFARVSVRKTRYPTPPPP
jgi:hypothetical protein